MLFVVFADSLPHVLIYLESTVLGGFERSFWDVSEGPLPIAQEGDEFVDAIHIHRWLALVLRSALTEPGLEVVLHEAQLVGVQSLFQETGNALNLAWHGLKILKDKND